MFSSICLFWWVFLLFICLFIYLLWIWHYVHGMWHRLLGMLYKQWHRKLSQDMYTNINAKYMLPLEVYYILCLLHGFPCRIYLLAHYAFVASKIRMVPQGNEIFYSRFQGRLHGKHCSYSETLQLLMLIIDTKAL